VRQVGHLPEFLRHVSALSHIREVHFKGLYIVREYLFSLESVTRVSLRVQDTAVLGTEWPVQH
jgi:hypothetical protein